MPRLLEKVIEARTIRDAKKLGIKIILKLESRTNSGFPDRLFLIPGGRPIFVEFKREGEKPRPLQEHRLRQLKDLGYDAIWVDNYIDAIRAIRAAMDSASTNVV